MSSDSNAGFIKSFIKVLLGLVVFTMVMVTLGESMAPPALHDEALLKQSVADRIAPAGVVRTAASAGEASDAAPEAGAVATKSPEDLYNAVCAACHSTGVAGAPKRDDKAAWAERGSVGVDALVASAIAGKGAMPPKGGSSYSEDEIKSIVGLFLAQ